ncbi:MAG: protein kinase [Oligosphaeraceae bacterium]|nr:protein kinase [Oligosphaeraceae bacterium]
MTYKVSLDEQVTLESESAPVAVHKPKRRPKGSGTTSIFTSPLFEKGCDLDALLSDQIRSQAKNMSYALHVSADEDVELVEVNKCFDIGKSIAEGGQGILARARDLSLKREVALKSLRQELTSDRRARECFLTEAQVTAQLDHPTIVPIYSLNTDQQNGIHLAMKLIKGQTLKDYLEKIILFYEMDGVHKFDVKKGLFFRLEVFLRVCDAISYAHSRNIMHCDLKPENIMIGEYNETYVLDWGIAKLIYEPDGKTLTRESRTISNGTPRFLPPEALLGLGRDERSDIFALGAILFEITTLDHAYSGKSANAVMRDIKNNHRNPIKSRFRFRIDGDLKAIINKAMAFDREQRYQTVDALAEDLRRYMRGDEVTANPDYFWGRINRWCLRHSRLVLTAGLLLLTSLLSLYGWSMLRQMQQSVAAQNRNIAAGLAYNRVGETGMAIDRKIASLENTLVHFGDNLLLLLGSHTSGDNGNSRFVHYRDYQSEQTRPASAVFSMAYNQVIDPENFSCFMAGRQNLHDFDGLLRQLSPLHAQIPKLLRNHANLQEETISQPEFYDELLTNGLPVAWVYFTFSNGLHLSYPGSGAYADDYNPQQREWYLTALQNQGQPVWGKSYRDSLTNEAVITCSMTVNDAAGNAMGVAGMDITLSKIKSIISESGNLSTVVAGRFLVSQDGTILIRSGIDPSRLREAGDRTGVSSDKVPGHLYQDMRWKKYGTKICTENGMDFIYAFARVPSINCTYLEKIWLQSWLGKARETEENHPPAG